MILLKGLWPILPNEWWEVYIIENDIKADETKYLEECLNKIEDINYEKVILSDESREVVVYIAGYIAKKKR